MCFLIKNNIFFGTNISGTYDINGVINIQTSGKGNTDISGRLQYLITEVIQVTIS